jgi:hypothetical protein
MILVIKTFLIFSLSKHQQIQDLKHVPKTPLAICQEIQDVPQQEVLMINIPALYLCRSDLCRRSHVATSLSRENPQISIAIPHAYIKIQLL